MSDWLEVWKIVEEYQRYLTEPWQDLMALGARGSQIWDFVIFNSGWDCTIPDGSGLQLGGSPVLVIPAQRGGCSYG